MNSGQILWWAEVEDLGFMGAAALSGERCHILLASIYIYVIHLYIRRASQAKKTIAENVIVRRLTKVIAGRILSEFDVVPVGKTPLVDFATMDVGFVA